MFCGFYLQVLFWVGSAHSKIGFTSNYLVHVNLKISLVQALEWLELLYAKLDFIGF